MPEKTLLDEAALRSWLIQRVARELEIDPAEVDPTARIMTVGIDSLALIGIAGELAEFTDRELRAEILWEHETIDALARHLADNEPASAPGDPPPNRLIGESPLRILRTGSGRDPVVAVGTLSIAAHVKERLCPDVPVGWLQLDALYHCAHRVRRVSQMAAAFADELAAHYPAGRLTLVGFSYSGIVAFELAGQLVDRGRTVHLLLLEPARFDRGPLPEAWSNKLRRHLRELSDRNCGDRIHYAREKIQAFRDRLRVKLFRRKLVARKEAGNPVPSRFNWMLAEPGLMASLRGYRPSRLAGAAVLAARPAWLQVHASLWSRLFEQGLVVVPLEDVPDHHAVQFESAARVWMRVLEDWYADGCSQCPPSRCAETGSG